MRQGLALSLAVVGVVATITLLQVSSNQSQGTFLQQEDRPYLQHFNAYIAKYGKSYASKEAFELRYQ
jgi:hypothetical protein